MLKRSTFLAALIGAVVFSSSLIAGEVTKADREALVAHLKKTEAAFLKSIGASATPSGSGSRRPTAGRWPRRPSTSPRPRTCCGDGSRG